MGDGTAPLTLALTKFVACVAAGVQQLVYTNATFLSATAEAAAADAAVGGDTTASPSQLARALSYGAVSVSSYDCGQLTAESAQSGVARRRRQRRRLLTGSGNSTTASTDMLVRIACAAPSTALLQAVLGATGMSVAANASVASMILAPTSTVNAAATALAAFFAALAAGNATGAPALDALYTTLAAELADVPLTADSGGGNRVRLARVLQGTAAGATGTSMQILAVSPVTLAAEMASGPLGVPYSVPAGIIVGAVAAAILVFALVVVSVIAGHARRPNVRREVTSAARAAAARKARAVSMRIVKHENPLLARGATGASLPPGIACADPVASASTHSQGALARTAFSTRQATEQQTRLRPVLFARAAAATPLIDGRGSAATARRLAALSPPRQRAPATTSVVDSSSMRVQAPLSGGAHYAADESSAQTSMPPTGQRSTVDSVQTHLDPSTPLMRDLSVSLLGNALAASSRRLTHNLSPAAKTSRVQHAREEHAIVDAAAAPQVESSRQLAADAQIPGAGDRASARKMLTGVKPASVRVMAAGALDAVPAPSSPQSESSSSPLGGQTHAILSRRDIPGDETPRSMTAQDA